MCIKSAIATTEPLYLSELIRPETVHFELRCTEPMQIIRVGHFTWQNFVLSADIEKAAVDPLFSD